MADHSITIDVIGKNLQETVSLLKDIRDSIKNINSTPVTVKVNTSSATRAINALRQELGSLAQYLNQGNRNNSDAVMETINSSVDALLAKLDEINSKSVSPSVDSSEIDQAATSAERLANGLSAAASIADTISSVFSGLGDFGGLFADSFSAMSGMFSFDTVGTAKRYLTAMATKAVTGQISGILERYDIMNTFVPYMELAGVDAMTAQASLDAVDQSIRGIPIGLDEAAFRLRKYQMYMGDIDRATQFTIGIQKAITAGGATEQMKTTAYTQIDRLLATGKLGQSRQWLSLFNGLGVSLRFLREELALDPTADLKTIASDLANGTIATEDFIDAIARLAENPGLDEAIGIYKGTIAAWRSNINNAIKRGGQNILENINSVLEDIYGQGITGFMKNVRDGIDTVSKEAGDYIKENPQNIQSIGDAVGGLIDRVMGLDGGRFVQNLVENIGGLADGLGRVFDSIPPGFLEDFAAFATTWAGPMATLMAGAQSGLGVVLGVFERMDDFDMPGLMEKISEQIWAMADAVSWLLEKIPDGMLGDLMAFGLVWGKPLATVFNALAGGLRNISGALGEGVKFSETNGLFGAIAWIAKNQPIIAVAAAAIGAIALAAHSAKVAFDEWAQGVVEEAGLDKIRETAESLTEESSQIIEAYESTKKTYDDRIDSIRANADEAGELLQTILETDEKIGKLKEGSKYYEELSAQQFANIEKMKTLQPELAEILEQDTNGRLTNARALKEQGDAYLEYVRKMAEAEATKEAYQETYKEYLDARLNEQRNLNEQQSLYNSIRQWSQEQYNLALQQARQLAAGDTAGAAATGEEIGKRDVLISEAQDTLSILKDGYFDVHEAHKGAKQDLEDLQNTMYETEVAARDADWNGDIDKLKETGDTASEVSEEIKNLAKSYDTLKTAADEALKSQQDLWKAIDEESETKLADTMSNIGENLNRYGEANRAVSALTDQLAGMELPDMTRSAAAQFISDLVSRGELGQLIELNDIFKEGGGLDWLANNSMEIFGNSNAGQKSLLSAENVAQLQLMVEAGGNIEKWTTAIETSDISGVLQSAGDAASNASEPMSDLAGAEEETAGNAQSVASNTISASGGINRMGDSAAAKSGDVHYMSGVASGLADAAGAAASTVNALARAIQSLQSKDVNINVNISGSGGTGHAIAMARAASRGLWRGGFVDYLADGGFPGIANGTDTVPAWLTPGEYVIRRSAVGMFGSRLMDRINKMDINGAFDALMNRISNPMNMHGNTYNRDNHAQVVINNYGNGGQDYSQRKAYRFVGAL